MNYGCMRVVVTFFAVLSGVSLWGGDEVAAKHQAKIDQCIAYAKQLAASPELVNAVAAQNARLAPGLAEMTQEKWMSLSDADPLVRSFAKNEAAKFLVARRTEQISEAFVSDSRGMKVAFINKTTFWCHKGKPKHDQPMAGQIWQGKLELDKSAGVMQVQVSVPILQEGRPIGSLVLGLSLEALAAD